VDEAVERDFLAAVLTVVPESPAHACCREWFLARAVALRSRAVDLGGK
jgi:hypothetical protein